MIAYGKTDGLSMDNELPSRVEAFFSIVVVGQRKFVLFRVVGAILVFVAFLIHQTGIHQNLLSLFAEGFSDRSLELVFDCFEMLGGVVNISYVF